MLGADICTVHVNDQYCEDSGVWNAFVSRAFVLPFDEMAAPPPCDVPSKHVVLIGGRVRRPALFASAV